MYSLLSMLVQREVGEMREGAVKDELLSQMSHFMGYFSAGKKKKRKKKKTFKLGNFKSDDKSASGFSWNRPFVSFTAVLSWSLLKLYLTSSRKEQTRSSAFSSFVRDNMSFTLPQLQDFLSVLARVNNSPWGWPSVWRSFIVECWTIYRCVSKHQDCTLW